MNKNLQTAKKKQVLDALQKSMGIISKATELAKISRTTFYKWLEEDENFKEQVNEVFERQIDFVESKLLSNINDGDTTAIIFFLKTKGRKRGYHEKTEIEVTTSELPQIVVEDASFTEIEDD